MTPEERRNILSRYYMQILDPLQNLSQKEFHHKLVEEENFPYTYTAFKV
jgi:hypothetical protein